LDIEHANKLALFLLLLFLQLEDNEDNEDNIGEE